jgi:K+-transporting ATPase ATPase A chain
MVGRTPEYIGKKIEAKEVKMAMLAILILPLMYLGWSAVATVLPSAVASIANAGPHGFSEILYLYTSSTANNGSAFGGITGNTDFYNITGAVAMFIGRFWVIIPAMAIAGFDGQTFSGTAFPKMPSGLKSRTRMRMRKATASL